MYPVLTYSRTPGDFTHALAPLQQLGLKAIRLIYKGLPETLFLQRIAEIQEQISRQGLDIDILVDLPGRKPAVGSLPQDLQIQAGQEYKLVPAETHLLSPDIPLDNFFDHADFPGLAAGDTISIADDELNLQVLEVTATAVRCTALNTFRLSANRSLSVKNRPFLVTANSEKDLKLVQALAGIPDNLKLVVSFTREAKDILQLKALQPAADIIPKIETLLDDRALQDILDCSQTLMLGRGDLSLACRPSELFAFQQHLISLCRAQGKRLIVATGLLSGIGDKGYPSIAEIADYAQLRHAGVEAFLITGSNAQRYPAQTLQFMRDFEV
ncbi:MAG TPA: pyruvate kinase [Chitinophagaceae bacterium]|nr:pyruvate kinase [Chitinophagaceae bacterium]